MYPCDSCSFHRRLILPVAAFSLLALHAPPAVAAENDSADALKTQADRWIEMEKRTADERNAWRAQKEVLETSIEVLKSERTSLQGKIEGNDLAASLFKGNLNRAEAELAMNEAAQASLAQNCEALEKRLRALFVRLPDPLKDKIGPLMEKLAKSADGSPPTASEKARILVAALTAIDLFNNTLTLTHHLRQNGSSETLDVKVLYWGLTAGYGVDARGEHAWMITPGANGWEWKEAPANVKEIGTLIAVYEKQNPELVVLPLGAERSAP